MSWQNLAAHFPAPSKFRSSDAEIKQQLRQEADRRRRDAERNFKFGREPTELITTTALLAPIHYTRHRITCHISNMAAVTPFMSFLRPMGLPRPATVRQFMHFSTSTPCLLREGTSIDINNT
jgi:hypothetical protein